MSWLEESTEATTEKVVDDRWLKIPDAPIGKTSEVKLRILDEEPVGTWRHWSQDGRPYNCPGISVCAICKVRNDAKKRDPQGYKKDYRMDYRYFFNVYTEGTPSNKIFSFGSGVGRKLKTFVEKYGDLRDFDVTIQKRKTGPLPMNVEYDVFYEGKSVNKEAELALESRYDLAEFLVPATSEVLKAVAAGEVPAKVESEVPKGFERFTNQAAPRSDMIMLKTLIEAKGFELSHFGIVDGEALPKHVATKLIKELQAEK